MFHPAGEALALRIRRKHITGHFISGRRQSHHFFKLLYKVALIAEACVQGHFCNRFRPIYEPLRFTYAVLYLKLVGRQADFLLKASDKWYLLVNAARAISSTLNLLSGYLSIRCFKPLTKDVSVFSPPQKSLSLTE